jgi:hypothetical protein
VGGLIWDLTNRWDNFFNFLASLLRRIIIDQDTGVQIYDQLLSSSLKLMTVRLNGLLMMVSFLARSAVVVDVGMIADRIGLHATYLISAGVGLFGIPFILILPHERKKAFRA